MILDAEYAVDDTRPYPVSGTVMLRSIAGGMLMFQDGDARETLTWDDDDPDAFIDNEVDGTVVIVTERGTLLFTRIENP